MKNIRIFTAASFAILLLASCTQEISVDLVKDEFAEKVPLSFVATDEQDNDTESKVALDFGQTANVRWQNSDKIAIFDGTAKNEFGIESGTNTGATATFTGNVTKGYSSLCAVYPYSAGNSRSGSSITVNVPSEQIVSVGANADPAALVSVGYRAGTSGSIEFKQVCALVKFEIATSDISQVVIRGTKLSGTATVAASTGLLSSVTEGVDYVAISYADGNFPQGKYYAAVLPGTTAAGNFSVEFVESSGLSHARATSSSLTFIRKQGKSAGSATGTWGDAWTTVRHIFNKAQLDAWGTAMEADEDGMTVYLDADIDYEGGNWNHPGAEFNGTLNGQGHKIYNIIVETASKTGFFYTLDGIVKDLVFGSSNGSSWDGVSRISHVGTAGEIEYVALACRLTGKGCMEGVTNFAKVEVPSSSNSRAYVGGLVGVVPDTAVAVEIQNCKNYGAISNNSSWTGDETRMGGILGQCSGAITASGLENRGAITVNNEVTTFIGGLCGDLASGSTVTGSSNYGTITFQDSGSKTTYLGGCFGSVRGNPATRVSDCHNYAAITATRDVQHRFGGITGFLQSGTLSLIACTNHAGADLTVASTSCKRTTLGGIAGSCLNGKDNTMTVTIQDCKNEASVINNGAASEIGGIVGMLDSEYPGAAHTLSVLNCENAGAVTNAAEDASFGNLGRELRIGGIIGSSDADSGLLSIIVRSCFNKGDVTTSGALSSGKAVRIGGISGLAWYDAQIDKCTNLGAVTCNAAGTDGGATMNIGGIVGFFEARTSSRYQKITDCVNTGEVSSIRNVGTQYIGGILGSVNNAGGYSNYGLVDGSKNYGTVSATRTVNTMVGGVCGYAKHTVSNCSNFGSVSGGAWNGAIIGDGNSAAVLTTGLKVGNGVEVTGATNAGTKYSNGNTTYSFTTTLTNEKKWFSGWADPAITVTVVDQESYDGGTTPAETGGYLFAHTGNGDGNYYRMFYAISQDGLSWTELNSGESPMPTYYGFPYITKDTEGTYWLVGISNTVPRHPMIWKSSDCVAWNLVKNIPRSVMALPDGYENDTNSFGAVKIFSDPVSGKFMLTWHASESGKTDSDKWESMRIFYTLTSDFETFTPAQKLFDFDTAQIDAIIYYRGGKYYAVYKDERTKDSSSAYYKRPRMCTSTSLNYGYSQPGSGLTDRYREAPTLVESPTSGKWYLYVEYYGGSDNIYECYQATSLTSSWSKVNSFTPPTAKSGSICRHGCVVPVDAKTYRRLQAAYGK